MAYIRFQIRRFAVVLYMTILLVVLTAIVLLSARSFTAGKAWVDHTTEVMFTIQEVQTSLLNAETGQRGYVITGDSSYLQPYYDALLTVPQQVITLRNLVSDNPAQLERVGVLNGLIERKLFTLKEIVEVRGRDGLQPSIKVLVDRHGKNVMSEIRVIVSQMMDNERMLMERRLLRVDDASLVLSVSLIIIVVRDLLVILLITYAIKNTAKPC